MEDLGVAGLQRIVSRHERLMKARVIVVAAGMEAALPTVVAGLVSCPVIGIPTSVGYGTSFGSVTAVGHARCCASNLYCVNIDAGFRAGYLASLINRTDASSSLHFRDQRGYAWGASWAWDCP